MLPLTVGALGIVYGDIGTSPLYSIRETFAEVHEVPVTRSSILGVLSLIFWSLVIVITVKYVWVVMRADNHGEGGILALTALVAPADAARRNRNLLVLAGLFGAALLYGDGAITPAISVLSAVEGFEVAAPALSRFVVPAAIAILIGLFSIQRRGSEIVGRFFGPVMVVWFVVLALLGVVHIVDHPSVLAAVNPFYAVQFFAEFTSESVHLPRRSGPGGDRGRGALCRFGAFRGCADQEGVVCRSAAGSVAELLRPGCHVAD